MKIRTDFVTNSSSSSFVVFGSYLNEILGREVAEEIENKWDYIEEKLKDSNLGYSMLYGDPDECAIGIGITRMMQKYPDAKLSEVRKIVADEINRVFNTNKEEKDIYYIEESWYDG